MVNKIAEANFPSRFGHFRIYGFEGVYGDEIQECVALRMGDISSRGDPPLVRIHSECLTGDVFHSLRCDCRSQLELSLNLIAEEGRGLLIYEHQEGRGIGLLNKLRAYELQDGGADTVDANLELGLPADAREYSTGAQVLADLGVRSVRLLTNNPAKVRGLSGFGIEVAGRVALPAAPTPDNLRYLIAKRDRLGHLIDGLPVTIDSLPVGGVIHDGVRDARPDGLAEVR